MDVGVAFFFRTSPPQPPWTILHGPTLHLTGKIGMCSYSLCVLRSLARLCVSLFWGGGWGLYHGAGGRQRGPVLHQDEGGDDRRCRHRRGRGESPGQGSRWRHLWQRGEDNRCASSEGVGMCWGGLS